MGTLVLIACLVASCFPIAKGEEKMMEVEDSEKLPGMVLEGGQSARETWPSLFQQYTNEQESNKEAKQAAYAKLLDMLNRTEEAAILTLRTAYETILLLKRMEAQEIEMAETNKDVV